MTPALLGILFAFAGAAMLAAPQDDEARQKALQAPFDAMEKSIREMDETAFKSRWHAEGFEKNFVGGSGLAGKAVFGQGSRKKWFLKPDLTQAKILQEGAAVIVPCLVWGWEKEKAVDKVNILLIKEKDGYLVLGGGEKREQVDALASRWLKKEPLDPPKEKE
jgi:hypothetical protein